MRMKSRRDRDAHGTYGSGSSDGSGGCSDSGGGSGDKWSVLRLLVQLSDGLCP
jgi:hypothetical protein